MRRIAQSERGMAAVEFGLIAPILVVFLGGFMEFAWVSSARSTLEAATMRGARAVSASDCPEKRDDILKSIVQDGMSIFKSADGKSAWVESKAYSGQFGDVGEPEPFDDDNDNGIHDDGESYVDVNGDGVFSEDMGSAGSIGAAGQVVAYTAHFRLASLFPFISQRFVGSEVYEISAATVVRNEPVFRTTGCS